MRQKSGTLRFVKKEPIYYHLLVLSIKFVIFLGLIPTTLIKTMLNLSQIFFSKVKTAFNLSFLIFNFFKRKRGRPRTKSIQKFIDQLIPKPIKISLSLFIFLSLFFTYSYSLVKLAHSLPTPDRLSSMNGPLTTQFYDRNGKLLYRLYEEKNRKLIKLDSLPKTLINATVAIEDKNFYSHPGVDLSGILRALRANFNNGGKLQGGSTITQQLIKNTLLTSDKTFTRKIKEVILAFWTERIYSKAEILQMYFNEVAYGGTAWGIEAASQMYFGKEPRDLSLAEAAFLAGLPAAPSEYSPYGVNPNQGKLRQIEVLRRMAEEKLISQDEAEKAASLELTFRPSLIDIKAPHFVFYAKSILASKYGDRYVSSGGLKVITTLDLNIQEMAEDIVRNKVDELSRLNVTNGAALVTEAKTGHILAMVGSKDYFSPADGNYNVTTALRQPGSAIKVVTYTAAFKNGFQPSTLLLDSPTTFVDPQSGKVYSPVNYDDRFHGPIPLRVALASSYNVPAVKILHLIGIPAFLETAKDLGITTFNHPQNYGLSLTLGGADVTMIDMMGVYGTLANLGIKVKPYPILKVIDPSDKVLEDNEYPEGKRVVTSEVAYLITDILTDNKARVPGFGDRSLLEIPGYMVAVKTGTSDLKKDNWTFGYTPDYVVGAWVGNNDNTPMNPSLTSGVTGATPIWNNIMAKLLAGKPNLAFERPLGIVESMVNGQKDITIAGSIPKSVVGFKKEIKKDGNGVDKEIITFTDPFSSYTLDKLP